MAINTSYTTTNLTIHPNSKKEEQLTTLWNYAKKEADSYFQFRETVNLIVRKIQSEDELHEDFKALGMGCYLDTNLFIEVQDEMVRNRGTYDIDQITNKLKKCKLEPSDATITNLNLVAKIFATQMTIEKTFKKVFHKIVVDKDKNQDEVDYKKVKYEEGVYETLHEDLRRTLPDIFITYVYGLLKNKSLGELKTFSQS